MKTVTMRVTGLVQGVGFRWTTQMIAQELGITGTVKNNPDGSVSIVAQGDELPLEHFIKKIKASEKSSVAYVITAHVILMIGLGWYIA